MIFYLPPPLRCNSNSGPVPMYVLRPKSCFPYEKTKLLRHFVLYVAWFLQSKEINFPVKETFFPTLCKICMYFSTSLCSVRFFLNRPIYILKFRSIFFYYFSFSNIYYFVTNTPAITSQPLHRTYAVAPSPFPLTWRSAELGPTLSFSVSNIETILLTHTCIRKSYHSSPNPIQ